TARPRPSRSAAPGASPSASSGTPSTSRSRTTSPPACSAPSPRRCTGRTSLSGSVGALQDAAGDTVAGVAGGIGLVVVGAGMNDHGGAVVVAQAVVDGEVGIEDLDGQLAGGRDVDVRHVAGVRTRLGAEAVAGIAWIVVATGGLEGWL